MKNKHIVIVARELRTSTGRYIERLLHYLQQIDHDNDYTILLKPEDVDGWQPTNSRFRAVACPHKEYTFDEQIGLLRQLNGLKPDLVHFSMTQQPILYRGKTVTTIQDLTTLRFRNPSKNRVIFWIKQQVFKWLTRRVAHKSREIITISDFVKHDIMSYCHVSAKKITVTLESSDELPPSEPIDELQNKQFIMYVGRPMPHKNLGRLIDAFTILKKSHPNLHLVLVGKIDDNYRDYQEQIKRDAIKDVIFTDFISDGQLRWLYEHTLVYCFPSLSEGFGLPGLEAMRHGAVVASSNATSLPEVHGEAANYFDPYDTKDMVRAIGELIDNSALREQFKKRGQQQIKKFSWRQMAEQTLEVYKKALK